MCALYTAALNGDMKLIEKIKGSHYTNNGLYGACEAGNYDLMKYFIKCGAWDVETALFYACKNKKNNKEMIEYLISFDDKIMIDKQKPVNIRRYEEVENFLILHKYIEKLEIEIV